MVCLSLRKSAALTDGGTALPFFRLQEELEDSDLGKKKDEL